MLAPDPATAGVHRNNGATVANSATSPQQDDLNRYRAAEILLSFHS